MVVCLERGANDLHMVQQMSLPPHHLLLQQNSEWYLLVGLAAHPGCPGKKAVKRLCVFVCVCVCDLNVQQLTIARRTLMTCNECATNTMSLPICQLPQLSRFQAATVTLDTIVDYVCGDHVQGQRFIHGGHLPLQAWWCVMVDSRRKKSRASSIPDRSAFR